MSLLDNLTTVGHLTEALIHFNYACEMVVRHASKVEVARTLFDGLNKLQTEWLMSQTDPELGEVKAFQTMIALGLSPEAKDTLLRSAQIQCVVALNPKIMNHDVLRRRGHRPDVVIETSLATEATEVHRKLENAYREFVHESREEVRERVIKRLAEMLYIVRSNIAHGEKTPYGPDLNKRERDEQVCTCIVPLQELLLDMLLGQASKKLISYGTLAPGQPNHSLVSDMKGEWKECVIRGTLNQKEGLSRFSWSPAGSEQNASLFTSDDLQSNWHRIDQFEGARYRRQLVPAKTRAGIEVAYAYITI
jgi:gamma-glutamylcyclotransferase (GGCT)/AIG2-like uncharacterized protein YtfP